MLHESHVGIVQMKSIARSYVWWPGLDGDLDVLMKSCQPCQETQNATAVAPLNPWLWQSRPWARIHIDFASPFFNLMFLIIVDAHSKWPKVVEMKTTTSSQMIVELQKMFSIPSIPELIVSNNSPQFSSSEFGQFCKVKCMGLNTCTSHHTTHPSSNGLAERFVQTFKKPWREEWRMAYHSRFTWCRRYISITWILFIVFLVIEFVPWMYSLRAIYVVGLCIFISPFYQCSLLIVSIS